MVDDVLHVAVVGAGVAGLTCAAGLRRAGIRAHVFEKSRGLGGRVATRRVGSLRFDHGAQYFTAKGAAFRRFLAGNDAVRAWLPQGAEPASAVWFVGAPQQNSFLHGLIEAGALSHGVVIRELVRDGAGCWTLVADDGAVFGGFDAVIVSAPAPQALTLLGGQPAFRDLQTISIQPCWALMLATDAPLPLGDSVRDPCHDIAWLAANHSKPGRDDSIAQYVIHATPGWSAAHLELPPDEAAAGLLERLQQAVDSAVRPRHLAAHRWRYALVDRPLGRAFLWDAETGLAAVGDGFLGGRVEAAFASGAAVVDVIARHLGAV